MRLRRVIGVSAAAAVLSLFGAAHAPASRADTIDRALGAEAHKVMEYLRAHNYHTVGVLNFTVKKGDRPETRAAGTLNAKMAARLEHALIFLADGQVPPVEILHDPGRAAASQSRGATVRTAQGRRGLFDHLYPVAWGDQKKKPDAFLTGKVLFRKDMKSLSIVVQAFSARKPDAVDEVLRVNNVRTDRDVLASIDQGFVLPRRLARHGARDLDEAAADDAAARDGTGENPLKDADSPIRIEIFYDDQPVPVEPDAGSPGEVRVRAGNAADPKEGQKVKFVLINVSSETVGAVLAVNGKSTLFLEDLTSRSPGECTKWILGPGDSYTIAGFYTGEGGKELHVFKVLSDDESARSELSEAHKGVFALHVFRELAMDALPPLNISSEGGDLARSPVLSPGKRGLADVQAALRASNHTRAVNGRLVAERVARKPAPARHARQTAKRGLVVEDEQPTTAGNLNRLDKMFDLQPTMSLAIRYYSGPTPATE